MRILLDNCLPIRLRHHFPSHEVETALYRGWAALENGELIRAAVDAGFDVVRAGGWSAPVAQVRRRSRSPLQMLRCANDWGVDSCSQPRILPVPS